MKTLRIRKLTGILIATGIAASLSTSALASLDITIPATGTGPDGQEIDASAHFVDLGGNQLQVTLANTYAGTTYGIAEVLYGVYFNGASGLTLASATTPLGSVKWDLNATPKNTSFTGQDLSAYWKLSSFGSLIGASALGGGNQSFGLVSAGFDGTATDGLPNAQHNPYLQNSITLLFGYTSLGDINNVAFQYGTAGATYLTPVPEPTTVIAGLLLLLPLGASTLKIWRKK